jgi:hypothetical protein
MSIRIDGTNTTANPGITGGDADTGLQFGTDEVSIVTGGTARVTVDSTGGLDAGAFTVDGSAPADSVNLDSSGRLLVGTSSSRAFVGSALNPQLQIEGTNDDTSIASITRNSNNTGSGRLIFGKSRGTTNGAVTGVQSDDNLGSILFEGADGTDTTTAAAIDCAVDGTPGANDMPGRLVFSTTANGASSPTEAFRITQDQEINFSASAVSWNIRCRRPGTGLAGFIEFLRGSTSIGSIVGTATNTSYNTSSDYRLKENVISLTGAADRLNQLQVRRFNFIADPDTTVDGFLAHEAQAVVPECVTGTKDEVDDEGNPVYQGIDQSKLVPLLTAALQEAIGRIETLETRLTALEGGAS